MTAADPFRPLRPLAPFEPVQTDELPAGGEWTAQIKWDGVRVLTYADGANVRLFNRRGNERTAQYPELLNVGAYCSARQVILDGEVIALEDGKPSFHRVMTRDGLRSAASLAGARSRAPIVYMVFDVLYADGEWLTGQPLRRRQDRLSALVAGSDQVQLVENHPRPDELYRAVAAHGMEGIVLKELNSVYAIGGKDRRWLKKKNYLDLSAAVGGVTLNGGQVNALLLGVYDGEGRFVYVGHAGTGKLSRADWAALTTAVRPLAVPVRPFVNRPERERDAVWLKPALTVKVRFQQWTAGGTLRQPSIQAFLSLRPEDCTLAANGFAERRPLPQGHS